MVGEHTLVVENRKVRYEITIKHKLNIIIGESGTGKTLMCKMLNEGVKLRGGTPIRVKSDLKVTTVESLEELKSVVFTGYQLVVIDEIYFKNMVYGDSGESIARLVKDKDVYCIFITREHGFTCLPVDVYACYRFSSSMKSNKTFVCNEQLYDWSDIDTLRPSYVYTEDTGVGETFFSKTLPNALVRGVGGTGNFKKLLSTLKTSNSDSVFLVADGCAFGMLMPIYLELRKEVNYRLKLFLPPSFEYLILASGIIPKVDMNRLINAYSYSRIEKYMSLEKYYEDYLSEVTNGKLSKNSKALENYILRPRCVGKIYEYIKEIER